MEDAAAEGEVPAEVLRAVFAHGGAALGSRGAAGAAPAVDKQLKADNSFCVTHGARRGAQGASQGPRNLAARA